jgi:hypothetical protein
MFPIFTPRQRVSLESNFHAVQEVVLMSSGQLYQVDIVTYDFLIYLPCLFRFPLPQPFYKRPVELQSQSFPTDNTRTGRYDSSWICARADW